MQLSFSPYFCSTPAADYFCQHCHVLSLGKKAVHLFFNLGDVRIELSIYIYTRYGEGPFLLAPLLKWECRHKTVKTQCSGSKGLYCTIRQMYVMKACWIFKHFKYPEGLFTKTLEFLLLYHQSSQCCTHTDNASSSTDWQDRNQSQSLRIITMTLHRKHTTQYLSCFSTQSPPSSLVQMQHFFEFSPPKIGQHKDH